MAVNISNLKTTIKSILDTANDTAAAYDLSTGLGTRVQKVFKVNPDLIPIQSTLFPYVTVVCTNKEIELPVFAKNQQVASRMAEITFNVIGAVWVSQVSDIAEDPADEEIEKLMENVEQVIRNNATLSGTVKWTTPQSTTYHAAAIGQEQTHLRIGILDITAKVEY